MSETGRIVGGLGQCVLALLAGLNIFVGVFNMFPLLPSTEATLQSPRTNGFVRGVRGGKQRYFADVER